MNRELTLYHYWRSSCSWRVRWALAHKDIAYRAVAVNLLKGEQLEASYVKQNPSGSVPCLVVDGRALGESMAILEWLEQVYPDRALLPTEPLERAWVRQFSLGIVAGTQPLQNLSVMRFYSTEEAQQKKWAQHWIARGLTACEKLLEGQSGSYCRGNRLTFADLCLIPQVYNAQRFQISMEPFPRCRSIYDAGRAMESCVASSPEKWETVL